jgi:hypothetical protein
MIFLLTDTIVTAYEPQQSLKYPFHAIEEARIVANRQLSSVHGRCLLSLYDNEAVLRRVARGRDKSMTMTMILGAAH